MSCLFRSITVMPRPPSRSVDAVSRPSKPPPTTTAARAPCAPARTRSTSSAVRSTWMPLQSSILMVGVIGTEPVASTSRS
jgi:hypothetical protein